MKSTVAFGVVAAVAVLTACGSVSSPTIGPSASPAATASPQPTATASAGPTARPSATATATASFPEPEQIEPAAVIDLEGVGVIAMATDGDTLWAVERNAIVRIDTATGEVEHLDAPVMPDDTTLSIAEDGLWVTRWGGGRLYRLDPDSGEVLLEVHMPKAVRIAFIGEDMWVGREDVGAMAKVDRVTGEIGSDVLSQGAYGTAGLGDLWFTRGGQAKVVRVDPATGTEKASFDVSGETNCTIGGSFPDNVWTGCFGREVVARSASRIDPMTNTVATVASIPASHGGAVAVIEGQPWFIGSFDGADGKPFAGLLRIDPQTGAIEQFLSLAGADTDGALVAGDALWVADEAGHRILKVNLADLGSR